jgi:hypothetical protein
MTGGRDKRKRMDWVGVSMKNEGYQMAQKSDGKCLVGDVGDVWDGGMVGWEHVDRPRILV